MVDEKKKKKPYEEYAQAGETEGMARARHLSEPNVDVTETQDGVSKTFYGVGKPTFGVAGNIKVENPEEQARRAKLNPQERLAEDKEAGFLKGDYSLFGSKDELEARLKAGGANVYTGEQTALPKGQGALNVTTEPESTNKYLGGMVGNMFGLSNDKIRSPQMTEEKAKAAGYALAIAGTAVGLEALSAAGIGVTGIKAFIGGNIAKTGLLSSVLLKLAVGGSVAAAPYKIANDNKKAIQSQVQTADLINDSVKAGIISVPEAILQYEEIMKQILELEKGVRFWSGLQLTNWIGGGKDALVDIENAKRQMELKRQLLIMGMTAPQ